MPKPELQLTALMPDDFAHSEEFAQRLVEIYGEERAASICGHLAMRPQLSFWRNSLVEQTESLNDDQWGTALPALPTLRVANEDAAITQQPDAEDGRIYVQNPSSYLAVVALDPQPGEEVLDLAAAPGGKTIAIAERMANSGRLAAVEPVKGRFFRMQANLERCGVSNVQLYQRDGRGVGRAVGERFDRVLLDAPCSSEARLTWDDASSYTHWSLRKVRECSKKQRGLIRSAYQALKPGGVLVYSTCSFAPEENEAVLAHLLGREWDAPPQIVPLDLPLPEHQSGLTEWRRKTYPQAVSAAVRVIPDGVWSGFFIAKVVKPA